MLIGLDVGRSGARALAIDEAGAVLASAWAGYGTSNPRPGWAEQDPRDWWAAAEDVLGRVVAAARRQGGEVRALGLSGQMGGAVFLDRRGDVIRPALVEGDLRSQRQCEEIGALLGAERFAEIAGSALVTDSQAAKILWLRDVEPVQYRHVRRVLLPKDYVRLRLTGEVATDASDASGTLLLDLKRRAWSDVIIGALGVLPDWLPSVSESAVITGGLRPSVAADLGLPGGLPVAAGAGDAAAAAVGAGVSTSGLISSAIDGGGRLMAHRAGFDADPSGVLRVLCSAVPGRYLEVASTPAAGRAFDWWGDVLGGVDSGELMASAEAIAPGADGLYFLPSFNLEGTSRGAFIGLRADHRREHLTRALIEGVLFNLREGLDCLRARGADVRRVRAVGSRARTELWCRVAADVFNLPVETTLVDDAATVGAALLAGVAGGMFADVAAASAAGVRVERVFEPAADRAARYGQMVHTYRALSLATGGSTAGRMATALPR
ncbi:MAG: xylulokinase [Candidatus Dormibacteraeota bacterium]|nr:xylulokinase [Candidatus Dormibacteraeota bacterium]